MSSPVGSTKSSVWTLEYPIPYSVVVAPESDGQDYFGSWNSHIGMSLCTSLAKYNTHAHTQQYMHNSTIHILHNIPCSRKPFREKSFTNFEDFWLFAKVFSVKFGSVVSRASNLQKSSPTKVSCYFYASTNCIRASPLVEANNHWSTHWTQWHLHYMLVCIRKYGGVTHSGFRKMWLLF